MNTISTKIKVSLNIRLYYSYVESTYVSRLLTIEPPPKCTTMMHISPPNINSTQNPPTHS